MGVTGAGKSTLGAQAARHLGWRFVDADEYHSPSNLAKLRAGVPLTDDDRRPWLERLAVIVDDARRRGEPVVLACSALKRAYRDLLLAGRRDDVLIVHLTGDPAVIEARMLARVHFMPPSSLDTQLAVLEPPEDEERPLVLDVATPLEAQVAAVASAVSRLGTDPAPGAES